MENEAFTETNRYLTLSLGEECFAFSITNVREILDMTDITRIPQTPEFLRGVVNVRGSAVPVVDLRMKFGMGRVERTLNTRIVIVEVVKESNTRIVGALADSVKEVLELEPGQIEPPPDMGTSIKADFIRGIGKSGGRFILILDTSKVFSTEEMTDISRVLGEVRSGQAQSAPSSRGPEE